MTALLRGLEATLALLLAWLLVFGLPLRVLGRLFGPMAVPLVPSAETARADTASADTVPAAVLRRARAVAQRLARAADRLPWTSTCLVRAAALRLLLARRSIAGARIRFGVRKRDGVLEAHAWLLLGTDILLGGEGAEGYVPLADLGADGSPGIGPSPGGGR